MPDPAIPQAPDPAGPAAKAHLDPAPKALRSWQDLPRAGHCLEDATLWAPWIELLGAGLAKRCKRVP